MKPLWTTYSLTVHLAAKKWQQKIDNRIRPQFIKLKFLYSTNTLTMSVRHTLYCTQSVCKVESMLSTPPQSIINSLPRSRKTTTKTTTSTRKALPGSIKHSQRVPILKALPHHTDDGNSPPANRPTAESPLHSQPTPPKKSITRTIVVYGTTKEWKKSLWTSHLHELYH